MKLAVITSKTCWRDAGSPSGYATDGGFPMQMRALSDLFDETRLLVPVLPEDPAIAPGLSPLRGRSLSIVPLAEPSGSGWKRKAGMLPWGIRHARTLTRQIAWADAVHVPLPGDVSAVGMWFAQSAGKPLFVRHCGNWLAPETAFDRYCKWHMERFAGGRNVMLATGGADDQPSETNPAIDWIFSTSLSSADLDRLAANGEHVRSSSPRTTGPNLIIAARQDPEKGAGVIVEAMPGIREDFPNATLEIVGSGSGIERFRSRAEALGVSDAVRFRGKIRQAEVIEAVRRSDLFVFPTAASEGFPKAVHEAMACGAPVIATKVSVLPLLLREGGGVLLEERSPQAVRSAVRFCIEDDERHQELSRQAARLARSYVLERWRDRIGLKLADAWGWRSERIGSENSL